MKIGLSSSLLLLLLVLQSATTTSIKKWIDSFVPFIGNVVHGFSVTYPNNNSNNYCRNSNNKSRCTGTTTTTTSSWYTNNRSLLHQQQQQRHISSSTSGQPRKTTSLSSLFMFPLMMLDNTDMNLLPSSSSPTVLIVIVALFIGILANVWISSLINGKQGLGSYLSDGKGYNKSNFQPIVRSDNERAVQNDPLPWLQLPKLDYVEVAGQQQQDQRRQQSESMSTSKREIEPIDNIPSYEGNNNSTNESEDFQ